MPDSENHIGVDLKRIRTNLTPIPTQREVAQAVDRSLIWYKKIEQGALNPSLPKLRQLGAVLGIDEQGVQELSQRVLSERKIGLPDADDRIRVLFVTPGATHLRLSEGQILSPRELARVLRISY